MFEMTNPHLYTLLKRDPSANQRLIHSWKFLANLTLLQSCMSRNCLIWVELCSVHPLHRGNDLDTLPVSRQTLFHLSSIPTQAPICFLIYTFVFGICLLSASPSCFLFLTASPFSLTSFLICTHLCIYIHTHTHTFLSLPPSVSILGCRLLILSSHKTLSPSITPSSGKMMPDEFVTLGKHLALLSRRQVRTSSQILALSTGDWPLVVVKATDISHSLALLPPLMAVH